MKAFGLGYGFAFSGGGVETLNQHQERFGNVQMARMPDDRPKAYCSSGYCAGRGSGTKMVFKQVKQSESICPDCNMTLFWK